MLWWADGVTWFIRSLSTLVTQCLSPPREDPHSQRGRNISSLLMSFAKTREGRQLTTARQILQISTAWDRGSWELNIDGNSSDNNPKSRRWKLRILHDQDLWSPGSEGDQEMTRSWRTRGERWPPNPASPPPPMSLLSRSGDSWLLTTPSVQGTLHYS